MDVELVIKTIKGKVTIEFSPEELGLILAIGDTLAPMFAKPNTALDSLRKKLATLSNFKDL